MDEYFVTLGQPRPAEPEPELTPRQKLVVEQLDLPGHRPLVPGWLRGLVLAGKAVFGIGLLLVAALPVLALYAAFQFFDSLPW